MNAPRKGWGTKMPDEVRILVRAPQHPARAVDCPHCGAHNRRPCTTRSGRRRLTDTPVHPQRLSAWARTTAVCPLCQVEPGIPCHLDGHALPNGDVHPARLAEAEVTL